MDLVSQNLQDAMVVTLIGMLVVLFFLAIMIFSMNVMEKVVTFLNKKFPIPNVEEKNTKKQNNNEQEQEIAVAIAAVLSKM